MAATIFLANRLLDHLCGKTLYPLPTSLFVALYTAAPNASGGGTEAGYAGYARVAITGAQWTAGASAASTNNGNITFPAAGSGPTVVTHWGLFDAATSGNLLEFGALTGPVTILTGETPRFPPSNLSRSIL